MNSDFQEGFIRIPNNWYDDQRITNEELTVLTLLYRNYLHYQSVSLCSVEMLCNYMYINSSSNKRMVRCLSDTLSSLHNKKLILDICDLHYNSISIDNILNKNYVFYVELPLPPDNAFFIVKNIDLDKIFEYLQNSNLGKFNLIRYFVACRRSCSNDSKFGYLSQSRLKKLVTNTQSIQRYNKILQDELHLIRYDNNYLTPEKQYHTTLIGLYDDKENFDFQVKCKVDELGLIYTNKIKSNINRSVTQKVNNKSFDF